MLSKEVYANLHERIKKEQAEAWKDMQSLHKKIQLTEVEVRAADKTYRGNYFIERYKQSQGHGILKDKEFEKTQEANSRSKQGQEAEDSKIKETQKPAKKRKSRALWLEEDSNEIER